MAYSPVPSSVAGVDLAIDVFGDVGGGVLNQKVISAYDIYKPAELQVAFNRHRKYPGFARKLSMMGFRRGKSTPTTGHYEFPWHKGTCDIAALVSGGATAGAEGVISLEAASHYDTAVTTNGSARKASYPSVEGLVTLYY